MIEEKAEHMKKVTYANAVGYSMYIMVCMVVLAHASSLVNSYMEKPRKLHYGALKWVLRYVKGTRIEGNVHDGK